MSINQQLRRSQRYFAGNEMPDAVGIVAVHMILDQVRRVSIETKHSERT